MRGIDTVMKKMAGQWWYEYRKAKTLKNAANVLKINLK
jgi:hypothetical protein